ncbi:MAG: transcriptional regulator [Terracidiphilus sp.]|nr:transcriptional regulator [Terracidiphilus sp.]
MTVGASRTVDAAPGGYPAATDQRVFAELWISLASLLRSYTAAHGLHDNRHATIVADEEEITVYHQEKWLRLERDLAIVTWTRENGSSGRMEISDSGRLRSGASEEEMDLAAEAWARELMR